LNTQKQRNKMRLLCLGLFCVCAIGLLLSLNPAIPIRAQTTSPADYLRMVEEALAAVEQDNLPLAADALTATAQSVPANRPLLAALRERSISQDEARTQLIALRDAIQTSPPQPSAQDRATLRQLLSQPPFTGRQPNAFEQWLDELLHSFAGGLANGLVNTRVVLMALAVALIAGVVFVIVRNFRAASVRQTDLPAAPNDGNEDIPATSADALSRAQTLATSGDYRTAVRQLYLATLLWLDEQGKLRFDKSLTNRETLRAISKAGAPALADALRPIVELYDQVWYGFAAIEPSEFEQFRQRVEAVRTA
jgi:hypothetical protein